MKLFMRLFLGLFVLQFWGCAKNATEPDLEAYVYTKPPQLSDGLVTAHIDEVDLDLGELTNMLSLVENGIYVNIHSVLLAKDNKLVLEEYYPGRTVFNQFINFNRNTLHNMHSVTKSFNSALVGIAMMEGKINSVEEKLHTFFPEHSDILLTGGRAEIKLKHVLTMSAGLEWDERSYPYEDVRNDHAQMYNRQDWIRYVLEKPIVESPPQIAGLAGQQYNEPNQKTMPPSISIVLFQLLHGRLR